MHKAEHQCSFEIPEYFRSICKPNECCCRSSLACMFCGLSDDCTERFGEKKTYPEHDLTLHYYCLLLSSGIWQRGKENEEIYGFLVCDIKKEINRAKKLMCGLCKNRGASIGCVFPKCRRSFHYPCGVKKECIFQFTGSFRSYCWEHRPVQKIVSSQADSSPCTICLEHISNVPSYNVLHGPCCKTSWFHRNCLQRQALSAGLFFFRCTVCNNRDKFQKEMLRMGIHIPERDASWELEENAFQELLVRYQRCDAKKCVCRGGREYNDPERHIPTQERTILDILHNLRLQINTDSVCTMLIQRETLWESSIECFQNSKFCPSGTLRVKFTKHKFRKECKQSNGSLSEYFGLLLNAIRSSPLLEGSEHKNIALNFEALQDKLYYEAGRMVALALIHGGPAPGFFSQTLFRCLLYDPQLVLPSVEDVADPNVVQAILTIQSCQRLGMLKSAVDHYFDYLQKTGSLCLVQTVRDRDLLVKQLLSYHVIRRVQQPLESFKQGLMTLGVLEKIQAHPTLFWSALVLGPEKLTAKAMADLFTVTYTGLSAKQQSDALGFWVDYLEDTEEGTTASSLEDILNFATGLPSIPPAGFDPWPSVRFRNKASLKARKNIHCLELPVCSSYSDFTDNMNKAICKVLCKA
ncbi:G2/M phase-specific E3 ubiquitin-protein ligase isoform X3 [Xenopus laevis]|uniref:G2/M phase-specific E3 ubiquitin-protein ligase isoform X3 n=1 Tax=Xenopus laevis TaxID=8355 RepID=A0A8J1LMJ2_XENLA|nr:G2/M phase-specific E3 ubiquitin-protein ligase isoform X3 [Xenopus laevis]